MPPEAAFRIAVVGEDRQHFELIRALTEQVVLREVDWADGQLEALLGWQATSDRQWLLWSSGPAPAGPEVVIAGRRIRLQGRLGLPDTLAWRRTLLNLLPEPRPDVVVLARDLDGHPDRLDAMEAVARELPWPWITLIAWFQPEAEAWQISAIEPPDEGRLREVRERVGFDPRLRSHDLTSGRSEHPKDAKRILSELVDEDPELVLELLEQRGAHNGCAAFLASVRSELVPRIAGR